MIKTTCPNDGKPTAGRNTLCAECIARLDAAIMELPVIHSALLAMHVAAATGEKIGGSGNAEPTIPYRDAIGDTRADIVTALAGWAGDVAEHLSTVPPEREPFAAAEYLRLHLGWLATYGAAGDAWTELTEVHDRAVRLAHPNGRRRFVITLADGTPARCERCGGPLRATMHDPDDAEPSVITCGQCRAAVPATQWPGMAGDAYGTIADICALYGIPRATLYSYASRNGWRKIRQHGKVRYHWRDVDGTLSAREYLTTEPANARFPN